MFHNQEKGWKIFDATNSLSAYACIWVISIDFDVLRISNDKKFFFSGLNIFSEIIVMEELWTRESFQLDIIEISSFGNWLLKLCLWQLGFWDLKISDTL